MKRIATNSAVIAGAALLMLAAACTRFPDIGITTLKPSSLEVLEENLLEQKAGVEQFKLRGPFAYSVQEDLVIRLSSTQVVNTDLYLSKRTEKAPLVIFLHGHDATKENHSYQAMHLASWGMNCLAVQLPNNGPWTGNGRTLARLVRFLRQWPEMFENRIDLDKIILAGHSFGGYSVAVALAEGAPVLGGILLDPAVLAPNVPAVLRKIRTPVLLLGADERVYAARNRSLFFRHIAKGISEVSIRDADHEDAQFPAPFGSGTEEAQLAFASALTSAALSLAFNGQFDYAWESFGDGIRKGEFLKPRRK